MDVRKIGLVHARDIYAKFLQAADCPLHAIGGEVHQHITLDAVRPADPADLEQAVRGHG